MSEIDKMEAFSLVVRYLEKGKDANAEKLLRIIVRAMQEEKKSIKKSSSIKIQNADDAKLFHELFLRVLE